MYVRNFFRGVIEACYDPMLIRLGQLVQFTKLRGFFIGCGPSPLSLSISSWYFQFQKVHGTTPQISSFYRFSDVVPYGPLEVQERLLFQEMSWYNLSSSLTYINSIHRLGMMPSPGVYFWCHPGSRYIVRVQYGGFKNASLAAHLLSASLEFPVLQCNLLSRTSLERFI